MAMMINTNIASLNAQNALSKSQSSLQTSMQRLSSGLRINSAKDDAAGYVISQDMTSQINGLNQASRNASDGISLAQTAGGALQQITDNLQSIRQLAVQAANGTNSAADREALNQEVQQRIGEVNRVATQTSFNGLHILDGSFGVSQMQVGANAGQTVAVNLAQGVKSSQIGQIATSTLQMDGTVALDPSTAVTTIQVGSGPAVAIGASADFAGTADSQDANSAYANAAAINAAGISGLTVTAQNNVAFGIGSTSGTATGDSYSLTINGQSIFSEFDQQANDVLTAQQIADKINTASTQTGVTATMNGDQLLLSAADGRNITIDQTYGGSAGGGLSTGAAGTVNGVDYQAGGDPTAGAVTTYGTLTMTANNNITVENGDTALGLASADQTISTDTKTIDSVDISTAAGANDAIARMDSALATVNGYQANMGAIQNRLDSTVSSIQTSVTNLSAARSQITDANFAAETANLSRNQILQQAGTAMLAQANQLPQLALSLLK